MLAQIDLDDTTMQLEITAFTDEENATYGVPLTPDIVSIQKEELLLDTDEAIRFMESYNKFRNAVDWTYDEGNHIFITYLKVTNAEKLNPFEIWNDNNGLFDLFEVIESKRITLLEGNAPIYF